MFLGNRGTSISRLNGTTDGPGGVRGCVNGVAGHMGCSRSMTGGLGCGPRNFILHPARRGVSGESGGPRFTCPCFSSSPCSDGFDRFPRTFIPRIFLFKQRKCMLSTFSSPERYCFAVESI